MIRQKEYMSWSQFSLWKSSKREYWKRYGLGEDRSANKYFTKGRELSNALEYDDDGESSNDELLSVVLENIPKLQHMEYKIECSLKNGEKILSYLDSCSPYDFDFYEYKTGKIPWTQEKVNSHDQLLFYALGLYIQGGRSEVPACTLYWIETEDDPDKGLIFTGVVEPFSRQFTVEEIEDFEDVLINAIDEIDAFEYKELEVDDETMDRYIELTDTIKTLQTEADLIRLGIQVDMEADEVNYASATNGKFTLTGKKVWKYSDDLEDVIAKFAKQVKIAQAQEQKDGIAKSTETYSLRFSANKTK